jgi:Ca2+-binding EF-hand superfamily protein
LRKALKEIDIVPVEDRLFRVIHEMKSDASNAHLNYEHFLRAVQLHVQPGKCRETHVRDDNETCKTFVIKLTYAIVSAFIALGGNEDRSGSIASEKLQHAVQEFGFTLDIETLINEIDEDQNGTVDFDEFRMMMNNSPRSTVEETEIDYEDNLPMFTEREEAIKLDLENLMNDYNTVKLSAR